MHANRHHPLAAGALALALACFAAGLVVPTAGAQCNYTALTSGTPVAVSTSPRFFTFSQPVNFWTAVAVQPPASGADWDISVWQDPYAYPGCVTNLLAGSALGGSAVDFVVGDYNTNAFGTRYLEVNLYSGAGDATVEWNATHGQLAINDAFYHADFAGIGSPFLYVWDVYLLAGTTYQFEFLSYGSAACHLLLFRNAGGGTCWKRRLEAEFDVTSATSYVAPSTGYYAVVVVNDNGGTGAAEGNVEACTPPIPLASGESQVSSLVYNYYSFDQHENYWTAVGLRRDWYSGFGVYRSDSGDPVTGCLTDELAHASVHSYYAGVIVGDFNYNAQGTYYALSTRSRNLPAFAGTTQWDDGADRLTVNGMLTHGTMGTNDVVRVWDVWLDGGTSYHFTFGRGGAELVLLLFRNDAGGEYWAGRWGAVLSTTADADYTAPSSGWYGVVVVNDDGAEGTYALGVGTCPTPARLQPNQPLVTTLGENHVVCDLGRTPTWNAIGVRGSDPGTDWDMVVQGLAPESFPRCHAPELAVSDEYPPTVDFVVGDFTRMSWSDYCAWPHTYFGQGSGTGTILWDATEGMLTVNAPLVPCALGADHFLRIWDVGLTAGTTYWLRYYTLPPLPDNALMLFRNQTGGAYWAARSDAEATTSSGEGTAYVAPEGTTYGVVAVNDGGYPGTGYVGIGTCSPPSALAPGLTTTSSLARNYYTATQQLPYWTAVGVRSVAPWRVVAYGSASGGTYPDCFGDALAASDGVVGRAGVVVGDFNRNPFGTYYLRSELADEVRPAEAGTVEWDSGADQITVGDPPVTRQTSSDDVLEVWDCWLAPQKDYTFSFHRTGAPDLKLLIFRNTGGGTYWVGRDAAEVELTGTATWKTTGSNYEFYALVVVNENGQSGFYTLQVTDPGPTAAEDAPPPATGFVGVQPNPARGAARLEFALHEPAEVSFQVLDMVGRLVATLPAREYGAGRASAEWDRRGAAGGRLPAGLYFVRMTAGSRAIGTRRVVLLD